MRDRHASHSARRAREFEAFVAGAAGRLLHAATLLTAEAPDANPRARRLLALSLAHTYAGWDRLHGEDPYDRARQYLATRFAREIWHRYGVLDRMRLAPRRHARRTRSARTADPGAQAVRGRRRGTGVRAAGPAGGPHPHDLRPGDGHPAAPAARTAPASDGEGEGGDAVTGGRDGRRTGTTKTTCAKGIATTGPATTGTRVWRGRECR